MPGRLTAIAIIGYTSLRLMSAQFDCGVSLLSTLHSSWDFTSCFAVTFSLPVATVTVFRALYRQNFLIWEFRSSFFTVLCSVVTGHVEVGRLWFVERLLFYSLVYALFWFVVRKPMRVQSGVNVVWIVFAVIIVSAANYWVRPA